MSFLPKAAENPNFEILYGQLKTLGLETMNISASSVSKTNKNTDRLQITDGRVEVEDAFILNYEYDFTGLRAASETMKSMTDYDLRTTPFKGYDPMKLNGFRLSLEDHSITDRGLNLASEIMGKSESQIKSILGVFALGAGFAAKNDLEKEIYSETASAFAEFVKDGGIITIETSPTSPFPLSPLVQGQADTIDPETLGFSAWQDGHIE